MKKGIIIAIDGPVAAGKGTIAPELAQRLEGFYLYTGATYRCLALYCLENAIDFHNKKAVLDTLAQIDIDLHDNRVFLNEREVTTEIKSAAVARTTPVVAAMAEVREEMVKLQQKIAKKRQDEGKNILVEGRDTATVVFPDADLKVFLTASVASRAHRRLEQYRVLGDSTITYEDVLQDMKKRDEEDTKREADPLVTDPKAHGYFIVDSTDLSESQTVESIMEELKQRNLII